MSSAHSILASPEKKEERSTSSSSTPAIGAHHEFALLELIGQGATSRVFKAKYKNVSPEKIVALKFVDGIKYSAQQLEERELEPLRALGSLPSNYRENIIGLLSPDAYPAVDPFTLLPSHVVIMEFASAGNILSHVRGHPFQFTVAKTYAFQLLCGIYACHFAGFCHRDIKPDNLLLDENRVLKIADFGTTGRLSKNDPFNTTFSVPIGTPMYVPPEVLANKMYNGCKADVWAAGVTIFVMIFGTVPWTNVTDPHNPSIWFWYRWLRAEGFIIGLAEHDDLSPEAARTSWWDTHCKAAFVPATSTHVTVDDDFKRLLEGMLRTNWKDRPQVIDCLRHPTFSETKNAVTQPDMLKHMQARESYLKSPEFFMWQQSTREALKSGWTAASAPPSAPSSAPPASSSSASSSSAPSSAPPASSSSATSSTSDSSSSSSSSALSSSSSSSFFSSSSSSSSSMKKSSHHTAFGKK